MNGVYGTVETHTKKNYSGTSCTVSSMWQLLSVFYLRIISDKLYFMNILYLVVNTDLYTMSAALRKSNRKTK